MILKRFLAISITTMVCTMARISTAVATKLIEIQFMASSGELPKRKRAMKRSMSARETNEAPVAKPYEIYTAVQQMIGSNA